MVWQGQQLHRQDYVVSGSTAKNMGKASYCIGGLWTTTNLGQFREGTKLGKKQPHTSSPSFVATGILLQVIEQRLVLSKMMLQLVLASSPGGDRVAYIRTTNEIGLFKLVLLV
jgi:hypothetical protein